MKSLLWGASLTHRCVSECLSASVPVCRAVLQDEGALLVMDSGGEEERMDVSLVCWRSSALTVPASPDPQPVLDACTFSVLMVSC